jgi:hypothetical protein
MSLSKQTLLDAVAILKSDDGENPEYDRALDELAEMLLGEEVEVPDELV